MHNVNQEKVELEHPNTDAFLGRCLVDGDTVATSSGVRSRRKAFGLSFVLEGSLLALLILSPLLASVAQPQLNRFTPPMIVNLVGWHTRRTNQTVIPSPNRTAVSLPAWGFRPPSPGHVVDSPENVESVDTSPAVGAGDAILSAMQVTDLEVTPPKAPPAPTVRQAVLEKHPVKIIGDIEQAQLISRIEPRYSPLAIQIRMEGTVVLHAIINREGRIASLEVVSGPPLLVQSAVNAVKQWRYRPTLLGGEPVEVETTITVTFRLQP